jgi:hypothetical protein
MVDNWATMGKGQTRTENSAMLHAKGCLSLPSLPVQRAVPPLAKMPSQLRVSAARPAVLMSPPAAPPPQHHSIPGCTPSEQAAACRDNTHHHHHRHPHKLNKRVNQLPIKREEQ